METFEATLTLRNNLLKQRRLELGLKPRELAERCGVGYFRYLQLEGMRVSPLDKKGEWRPTALKIAAFYNTSAEALWPSAVLAVSNPEVVRRLESEEVLALAGLAYETPLLALSPEEEVTRPSGLDMRRAMTKVLFRARLSKERRLTSREESILRRYYGLNATEKTETLREIAVTLSLSVERIKQLRDRATGKLAARLDRHPAFEAWNA